MSIDGFCENFIYLPIAKAGTGWSYDVVTADILYHTAAGEAVDYHYELRLREGTVIHRYRAQYKGKATYSLDFATDYYRNDYPGS